MLKKSKFGKIIRGKNCFNKSKSDHNNILQNIFAIESNEHLILEKFLNFRWVEQSRISQHVEEIKAGLLIGIPLQKMEELSKSDKENWKVNKNKLLTLISSKELNLYLNKSEHVGWKSLLLQIRRMVEDI